MRSVGWSGQQHDNKVWRSQIYACEIVDYIKNGLYKKGNEIDHPSLGKIFEFARSQFYLFGTNYLFPITNQKKIYKQVRLSNEMLCTEE